MPKMQEGDNEETQQNDLLAPPKHKIEPPIEIEEVQE